MCIRDRVQVISTSGSINYIGDFGDRGEYRLTSHSGNIEATVPESTSADVSARSVRGEVHDDIPLQPRTHTWFVIKEGSAFWGTTVSYTHLDVYKRQTQSSGRAATRTKPTSSRRPGKGTPRRSRLSTISINGASIRSACA